MTPPDFGKKTGNAGFGCDFYFIYGLSYRSLAIPEDSLSHIEPSIEERITPFLPTATK
jgi:hypothetical protein